MDVDATETGQAQSRRWQDQAVGDDYQHIGVPGLEVRAIFLACKATGLGHGKPQGLRRTLHRARRGVPTSTLRAVRLREYACEHVWRLRERVQGRQRELGGAGEGDAQSGLGCGAGRQPPSPHGASVVKKSRAWGPPCPP